MNQIKTKKSVRVFEDKAIAKEIKSEILETVFQGSTVDCQMLYAK